MGRYIRNFFLSIILVYSFGLVAGVVSGFHYVAADAQGGPEINLCKPYSRMAYVFPSHIVVCWLMQVPDGD